MNKKSLILFFCLLSSFLCINAQEAQKSELQQRAEAEDARGNVATARYLFIRSFEEYVKNGQTMAGTACAVKAAALYHKENYYKEAFDLLRRADQAIAAGKDAESARAAMHYLTTKERLQMYMKLRKSANALEQLNIMEGQASTSGDESVGNDLLYTKAIYYYTFGQNEKGNAVFKEMADKLTSVKEYDKVDEVYQTLIANGRRSNNASLVAQSYSSYIVWKDSVSAMKTAEKIDSLKQRIADSEASIEEKDSALSSRWMIILGLGILAAALAAALAVGAIILLRFILLTRKQKKTIKLANENNALKAKFIGNISAQLDPTLQKLDSRQPEVKALIDFSSHIQTLSALENTTGTPELEETQVMPFCEALAAEVRNKVKHGVTVKVNAPQMSAKINKEYTMTFPSYSNLYPAEATIYQDVTVTIVVDYEKVEVDLLIETEAPAAIEDQLINADKVVKTIENGQVVIIRNGQRFNVLGARL